MLRQQDVGHRIVVRRIVGIREGRPLFSDALGELVELSETHLTIATAQGRVRVPVAEVHRAKRVPPTRRPTASAVVELELAADEAWPAPVRGRLGDWLLRSADGWTGRANSALPVGDPDRPLPAAVDAIERWYAGRGQPAMVNTPLPLAVPVGAELDARGWTARPLTLVQTVPLTTLRAAAPPPGPADRAPRPGRAGSAGDPPPEIRDAGRHGPAGRPAAQTHDAGRQGPTGRPAAQTHDAGRHGPAGGPAVVLAVAPSEEWLAVAAGRKGGLPDSARHILTAVSQVRFAQVYADGVLVATGRGTITGQGRWLGLGLIEVAPPARRQGLAARVIRALADWGAAEGATHAFLQVEQRNTEAVSLYRKLGFTTHHTYLTRVAPPT
ncbi:Acetyltransferase (GNAT) family protein [Micromonospora matsumotoense]|uniref:Acetyltransferase (GNAT) family protein n=1 Tax=Micromonospora matsumotoense TaxID=121616 RepID=A0A1C4W991_9ACTN|nr:GNAT family N-acetyltransferase [Micromonospora matsumotoense]SCE92689.1 Acetyltransferase (GNAT) family protein [Micromonospora matsumotoense]